MEIRWCVLLRNSGNHNGGLRAQHADYAAGEGILHTVRACWHPPELGDVSKHWRALEYIDLLCADESEALFAVEKSRGSAFPESHSFTPYINK
jgi:hypothetical protein